MLARGPGRSRVRHPNGQDRSTMASRRQKQQQGRGRSDLDPMKIFVHAYRFQWSSERLRDSKHLKSEEVAFVAHPSMVLSAFASEVYLKCLLCIETGKVACTRFRRHRVRCFDGAGGGSWRDESSRGSSSLRLCA